MTAYGEPVDGAWDNGHGFTGHQNDAATKLIYMQQRYYDPIIGRFLSGDPLVPSPKTGGLFNRYTYGNNNPYRFTDPDGRCPKELSNKKCISSSNVPANAGSIQPSAQSMDTFQKRGGRLPDPEPGKETSGAIVGSGDGKERFSVRRTTSTQTDSANVGAFQVPKNTVMVVHQHSPGGDLKDDKNPTKMGDAGVLERNGIPNGAQTETLRRAVHGVWAGQYQIRAVGGIEFTDAEIEHFEARVDFRQERLNEANQ